MPRVKKPRPSSAPHGHHPRTWQQQQQDEQKNNPTETTVNHKGQPVVSTKSGEAAKNEAISGAALHKRAAYARQAKQVYKSQVQQPAQPKKSAAKRGMETKRSSPNAHAQQVYASDTDRKMFTQREPNQAPTIHALPVPAMLLERQADISVHPIWKHQKRPG